MRRRIIFSLNLIFIFIYKILKFNDNYFITANAELLIVKKSEFRSRFHLAVELKKIKFIKYLSKDKIFHLRDSYFRVDINKVCSGKVKKSLIINFHYLKHH